MRTARGLITAYWCSERWVEAWSLSIGVILLTTLLSKASVWVAMASAEFLDALVSVPAAVKTGVSGGAPGALSAIAAAAAVYAALALGRIGGVALRHFASSTLHRKARAWVQGRFQAALLADRHIVANLVSDRAGDDDPDRPSRLPDNIDQRVDECSEAVFGTVIGLVMGLWGAIASIYFVSIALMEHSAPVALLDEIGREAGAAIGPALGLGPLDLAPGPYGTALLAGLLVALYVPLITLGAWCLGRVLEARVLARQRAGGTWRGELGRMLSRAPVMAISRGERAQSRVNQTLYRGVDTSWHRLNGIQSGFMAFQMGTMFITNRLIGYLPALPAYLAGSMSFKDYAAGSELVSELVNDCSWFVNVMPALATLRANAGRLTELATAIDRAGDSAAFYAETGVSAFERGVQPAALGLSVSGLALHHRGEDAPFLTVPDLAVAPGRRVLVRAANGAGKSSLLKAIAGLWPYGRGRVTLPAGVEVMAISQDPDLPERLSLRELVTYPAEPGALPGLDDRALAAILAVAGLDMLADRLDETLPGGRPWSQVLSGGQRQRLVLARILVARPGVLLLDEATAAMDAAGARDFHDLIRDRLPGSIVISIEHEPEGGGPDGYGFFTDVLTIAEGRASLAPLAACGSIAAE
ncbi:MAG: ATP-binding cassette domain-containing protein [Pseudomonadota bacterium]